MTRSNSAIERANHWYQQPIAWLGIAITVAIFVGCVWTIVVSSRYTDVPTHGDTPTLLGMPLGHTSSAEPAEQP